MPVHQLSGTALFLSPDEVQDIVSARFAALGWQALRNEPAPNAFLPPVEVLLAFAHREQGVALVDLAPTNRFYSVLRLRRRLEARGMSASDAANLPILYLSLTEEQLGRLGTVLEEGMPALHTGEVTDPDWLERVQRALLPITAVGLPSQTTVAGATVPPAIPGPFAVAPRLAPTLGSTRPGPAAVGAPVAARTGAPMAPVAAMPGAAAAPVAPPRRTASLPPPDRLSWKGMLAATVAMVAAFVLFQNIDQVKQLLDGAPPAVPRDAELLARLEAGARPPLEPQRPATQPSPPAMAPPRASTAPGASIAAEPLPPATPRLPTATTAEPLPAALPLPPPPPPEAGLPAAAPDTAMPAGPLRIVIHHPLGYRDGLVGVQERIGPVEGSIESRGAGATPSTPIIRFFSPEDEAAAGRLANRLGPAWTVQDFTSFRPRPNRGLLEVWIPRDMHGGR